MHIYGAATLLSLLQYLINNCLLYKFLSHSYLVNRIPDRQKRKNHALYVTLGLIQWSTAEVTVLASLYLVVNINNAMSTDRHTIEITSNVFHISLIWVLFRVSMATIYCIFYGTVGHTQQLDLAPSSSSFRGLYR